MKGLNVVLLDDSLVIREIIRRLLQLLQPQVLNKLNFYSSSNGVEGLGYVFVTKPDILIIDTTLPKYSGRELIDYLHTNERFSEEDMSIVILQENPGKEGQDFPANFVVVDKNKIGLSKILLDVVISKTYVATDREVEVPSYKLFFADRAMRLANYSDKLIRRMSVGITCKLICFPIWLFQQVMLSLYLSVVNLANKPVVDDNIEQQRADERIFRVRYYPTIITFLVSVMVIICQLILFIVGGVVILNTKVESFFGNI